MESIYRFFNPPAGSFFLFGPRGTGKSTLVKRSFPGALYLDLLDPEIFRRLSANPELLRERMLGHRGPRIVVVDEVQKAPHLLDLIHKLIEDNGWQFVLTGSSARKIKRTGADMLAGRALKCSLHPFMAAELGRAFSLDEVLERGTLPVVLGARDPGRTLAAYAGLYLKEEVQAEGLVRNVGNFARFLEAISFSHASQLNISNVAREAEVERKVAEGYVSVLEDLLLGYRVPVFAKRAKRALVSRAKFYLFDCGVYRSLRPSGPLDRAGGIEDAALEGLVAQHLRAWIDYSERGDTLYFWRTHAGVEVDFVVYGPDGITAIEVKNTRRVRNHDLKSMRAFVSDYPESRPLFVYRGSERLVRDGIPCIPCDEFLASIRPGEPL
jgi:predicted AAA+ superfamily ATPase